MTNFQHYHENTPVEFVILLIVYRLPIFFFLQYKRLSKEIFKKNYLRRIISHKLFKHKFLFKKIYLKGKKFCSKQYYVYLLSINMPTKSIKSIFFFQFLLNVKFFYIYFSLCIFFLFAESLYSSFFVFVLSFFISFLILTTTVNEIIKSKFLFSIVDFFFEIVAIKIVFLSVYRILSSLFHRGFYFRFFGQHYG